MQILFSHLKQAYKELKPVTTGYAKRKSGRDYYFCLSQDELFGRVKAFYGELEASFEYELKGESDSGQYLLPIEALERFLAAPKNLSQQMVEITKNDSGTYTLKCGNYSLPYVVDEKAIELVEPVEVNTEGQEGWISSTVDLTKAIKNIIYAALTGDEAEMRPVLGGIHFCFFEHQVKLAAADNFQLAYAGVAGQSLEELEFIIPTKALKIIVKLFGKQDQLVKITKYENSATIVAGSVAITAPLVVGKYPRYTIVAESADHKRFVDLDVNSFLPLTLSNQYVIILFGNGQARAINRFYHEVKGENSYSYEQLKAEVITPEWVNSNLEPGELMHVALQAEFFRNIMAAAGTANVLRLWSTVDGEPTKAPVKVTFEGRPDIHLVMPMFLNGPVEKEVTKVLVEMGCGQLSEKTGKG